MGRTGTRVGWRAAMCALAAAAAVGCGGGSSPTPPPAGPPTPVGPGTPLGLATNKLVGPAGGSVTSSDGLFTVSVPAGAVSADIDLSIEVITNTAPSAVGNAYRIAVVPAGTVLAAPIALVFTPPAGAPALDTLTLATQDENGFWVRQQSVTRDATAGTLTVTTTELGDWAIVGAPTGRDLIGVYQVTSSAGTVDVTADGKSALNFHAGDLTTGWYVQSGTITARSPVTSGSQTCAPGAPTMTLAPNVAEVLSSPDRFRWAVDGHWDLACGSFPPLAYVAFDTTGINYLSCARTHLETPLITPEKLLGSYRIDCGPEGTVEASWHFEICNQGEPCPSSNPCHTASITCDTGLPLCVDDGNVPNGLVCDLVPAVHEVCGDGVCNVCRLDQDCDPTNVCNLGRYTCDTGFEVCTDLAQPDPSMTGQTCDVLPSVPEVCGNGTCNACTQDEVCTPSVCNTGNIQCASGFPVCADTGDVAPGTVCDVNPLVDEVCTGTGSCIACTAGLPCSGNSNVCVAGVTSCHTGGETCENTATAIRTGELCDVIPLVDEVCFNGGCNACTANLDCTDNPNECVAGVTSCTTGQSVCVDTTTAIRTGLVCEENPLVDEVCNAGVCNACTAGNACSTNPNQCVTGTTSCLTGVETCVDTATPIAPGTFCGLDQVCNGTGTCVACIAGVTCTDNANACVAGVTSCATGGRTCENTATPIPAGTTCGLNQVCNGTGTCIACTASLACSYNSNRCVVGTTSCATGGETCENTATPIPPGTACDVSPLVDEVCNGAGACVGCTAGLACAYNSNRCVAGTTSCATGGETCENTATPFAPGTACDVIPLEDEVCDGAGACVVCTANQSCDYNSNVCYSGVTSCTSGGETCENAAPLANGTVCGPDQVCNGGVCSACVAGGTCSTNPNPCVAGTNSCATGTQTCVDTATPIANGTTCGTDQVCSGGACVSCVAGLACADDPDPCHTGTTSCATGTSQCVSTATPEPNGTLCGPDQVCNAGVCSVCSAGDPCEGNPTACLVGETSCATGVSTCVDTATPEPPSTPCGTDQVCSGTGICNACVAGADCTAFGACTQSLTSCATGTQTCVDTFSPLANGTACGTDQVCNGGVCSACVAGDPCSSNPSVCLVGVTSCATGVQTCEDTAAQIPNGTSCGADAVCSAGVCSACVADDPCATNPNPCVAGVTSCATGTQACVDTAVALADGITCGTDQVCNGGVCATCIAGASCTTNPNSPCTAGVTSCATGSQVCVDNPGVTLANGTSCGTNLVCSAGACVACTAGLACEGNPTTCLVGVTSCATGSSACVDSATPEPNGTVCGAGAVCNGGVCSACTASQACNYNSNPCVAGITSCATGVETCENTASPIANGTTCGTDQVCNAGACVSCVANVACADDLDPCHTGLTSCSTGTRVCVTTATSEPNGTICGTDQVCNAGVCSACSAGDPCEGNPTSCLVGTTSCATGTQTCVDTATPEPAGSSCGTDQVCSGTGVCNACVAGLDCTAAGACTQSLTSCTTGTQTCVETGVPLANGTSCGTDLVCSSGVCSSCSAGDACSTNPTACVEGVTSCATGAEACLDTATPLANGTSCGTDLVCSGGACTACAEGAACLTNPDPCRTGVTSCATGAAVCVDGPAEPNGTVCGADQVCNGGACVACVAGGSCSTNPTACLLGTFSCATGTQACVDTALPAPNGTTCGLDQVCNGGVCDSCVAGGTCDTNPNPCVAGTFSCASGTQTCVDTAALEPDGTSCGTNYVCSGGTCTACVAGVVCTPANSCTVFQTSCATGTSVCQDTGTPVANGTVCGTDQVCSAGTCTACTAGVACDPGPTSCFTGLTSCSTGTSTCVATAVPKANGTTCGADQVCNAGACVTCVAGAACDTNPDPCHTGTTACATGTPVCVDSPTTEPNGTVCGVDQVCSGGTCVACVAGAACQNPGSCLAGTTSCATGASVCVDGAAPLPDGTSCGASSRCDGGACVAVRTVSGQRMATYWTTGGTCSAAPETAQCKAQLPAPDVAVARVSARPAAGGSWAEIVGTVSLNGSYSIPDVPAGPYRLVLEDGNGVTHVVETESSDVDLGYDVLGRADPTLATSPTLVTFDLTGLTPWFAEDEVEATAFDVDVFDVPVAGADVLSGQTTGGAIEDWGASSAGRALNLLAGTDVLHLHQLSTETATDGVTAFAYQRATVAASHVGQPTTVAAALAPMIDSGTITVSWDPQAFEALLPALGPAAQPLANPHRLLVETAPYASLAAAPVAAYGTPQLFRMVRPGGAVSPISLSPITYGRFLDVQLASEWRRAEYGAAVSYTASGASALQVVASVGRRDRMAPVPPTPIVPAVGPVQSPTVAAASALGTIPPTGATPVIGWSAPAIGTPTRYEVRLYALDGGTGVTVARPVAALQLTGTSVAVPAGLLQSGTTYFAEITAYAVADERFDVAPLRRAQVYSHATTLTSPFTP